MMIRALATILKSPVISERIPIQNGLWLYQMVQNGQFLPVKKELQWFTRQNEGHDGPGEALT